jgi:hypothetical protein
MLGLLILTVFCGASTGRVSGAPGPIPLIGIGTGVEAILS